MASSYRVATPREHIAHLPLRPLRPPSLPSPLFLCNFILGHKKSICRWYWYSALRTSSKVVVYLLSNEGFFTLTWQRQCISASSFSRALHKWSRFTSSGGLRVQRCVCVRERESAHERIQKCISHLYSLLPLQISPSRHRQIRPNHKKGSLVIYSFIGGCFPWYALDMLLLIIRSLDPS